MQAPESRTVLRDELGTALAAAGFLGHVPTVVIREGVTNYLTGEAVEATLRYLGRRAEVATGAQGQ